MAGDWIKLEKTTIDKPEIFRLSEMLGVDRFTAFGLCIRFWSWCDDHLDKSHAPSVTHVTIDRVTSHEGFAAALVAVGWISLDEGGLVVSNFEYHLSESAKRRALEAKRKAKARHANVTLGAGQKRDQRREEKRIDINPPFNSPLASSEGKPAAYLGRFDPSMLPIPEPINTPEFRASWESWMRMLADKGRPITQDTAMRQLMALAKRPTEAVQIVEDSILGNATWLLGIKEPSSTNKPSIEIKLRKPNERK